MQRNPFSFYDSNERHRLICLFTASISLSTHRLFSPALDITLKPKMTPYDAVSGSTPHDGTFFRQEARPRLIADIARQARLKHPSFSMTLDKYTISQSSSASRR